MDNGVKKVRQSIAQRKKGRGLRPKEGVNKQTLPVFPQEEEKHGYLPVLPDETYSADPKEKLAPGIVLKGILSVLLFFGVALLGQTDAALLDKPKAWTSGVLTKEFPFAKVNLWYQESFGSPLALTPQSDPTVADTSSDLALPVSGSVQETFQSNGQGMMIAPGETTDVSVVRDGIVIFAGKDRKTDKTVIVQHADGTTSTYGYLSAVDVHLYQFVKNSDHVGKFTPEAEHESVYFAIEKDNAYIDPVQVIKVDDTQ
jgi:stage IV sporulation protein FA